jgi:hypothetical protein
VPVWLTLPVRPFSAADRRALPLPTVPEVPAVGVGIDRVRVARDHPEWVRADECGWNCSPTCCRRGVDGGSGRRGLRWRLAGVGLTTVLRRLVGWGSRAVTALDLAWSAGAEPLEYEGLRERLAVWACPA